MTQPQSPDGPVPERTPSDSAPRGGGRHGEGPHSTPTRSAHPLPRHHWDLTRSALAAGGVLLVVLALTAVGPWFPLGRTGLDTRITVFGLLALALVLMVQGGVLAYLSGRWRSIWGWGVGAVFTVGITLGALHLVADSLPELLRLPIPRTAVLVAGVLLVVIALSRDSDTLHERDTDPDDWFKFTGRILQAVHFWTAEQAAEQMRRTRAEFDRLQSRRGHGEPELTPPQVFGTPDEYAASLETRPDLPGDPLKAGRWYYLTTAIALGAWAAFRSQAVAMNWLTVLLFLFAAIAFAMFLWASLAQRKRR